jgi:hypothetical protein
VILYAAFRRKWNGRGFGREVFVGHVSALSADEARQQVRRQYRDQVGAGDFVAVKSDNGKRRWWGHPSAMWSPDGTGTM